MTDLAPIFRSVVSEDNGMPPEILTVECAACGEELPVNDMREHLKTCEVPR